MSTYLSLHEVESVEVSPARFLPTDGHEIVFVQELVIHTKYSGMTRLHIYLQDPAKAIPVELYANAQTA